MKSAVATGTTGLKAAELADKETNTARGIDTSVPAFIATPHGSKGTSFLIAVRLQLPGGKLTRLNAGQLNAAMEAFCRLYCSLPHPVLIDKQAAEACDC